MIANYFTLFGPFLASLAAASAITRQSDTKLSDGCSQAQGFTAGVHTIKVGSRDRQFNISIPENYDNSRPHQLIFTFHFANYNMSTVSQGDRMEPYYGLKSRAGNDGILIAPDGLDAGWANTCGRDLAFVDAMIEQVEASLCIDQTKRFAMGHSFGGGMTFSLACSRPTVFRAFSGMNTAELSGCEGGLVVPVLYLGYHGVNDDKVDISRGLDLARRVAKTNGCQPENGIEDSYPANGSLTYSRTDFMDCTKPVSFIAFDGGHDRAPLGNGNPWAPDTMWQFFQQAP
jgi:poly(3-hydroxybutyrate) depolymerase